MDNQINSPEGKVPTDSPKPFLTPLAAVQIVWGYTMEFSRDKSITLMDFTRKVLTQFCGKVEVVGKYRPKVYAAHRHEGGDLKLSDDEKRYLFRVLTAMECALRSLDVLYKGRNYNWQEIEKLHEVYLKSLEDAETFGKKFKSIFRTLPSMALGSAGGITLVEAFNTIPSSKLWFVGLFFAALGYFVDLCVVKWCNMRKRLSYIRLDYERTCYYIDYLTKISPVLIHLYDNVKEIYEEVFFGPYNSGTKVADERKWIKKMVEQLDPERCIYTAIHMESNKITPKLWPRCETGKTEGCPLA